MEASLTMQARKHSSRYGIRYRNTRGSQLCEDKNLANRSSRNRLFNGHPSNVHYLARYSCSIADRVWRVMDAHQEFIRVMLDDLKF